MKLVFTLSFSAIISLALFHDCKSQVRKSEVVDFIKNDAAVSLVTSDVSIDTLNGTIRLNIYLTHDHYNEHWAEIAGVVTTYELHKHNMISTLTEDSLFFFSFWFQMENGESRFEVPVNNDFSVMRLPNRYEFGKQMTQFISPKDIHSYDQVLKQIFLDTSNEVFNKNFYQLFVSLGSNEYLEPDEKILLDSLINWSRRHSQENVVHLQFFADHLIEELIIEDQLPSEEDEE